MCSVLVGIIPLYGASLRAGGPGVMTWEWIAGGIFSLMHVSCLGEMASAFPTMGTMYYWAYRVGGRNWGPFASWLTGWLSLMGQVASIGAASYSAASEIRHLVDLSRDGTAPISDVAVFGVFCALLFLSAVTNMFAETLLTATSYLSIAVHLCGASFIVIYLLVSGSSGSNELQSPEWVLTKFVNATGFSSQFNVCLIGLLSAGSAYTGYDTAASVAEETVNSSDQTPQAMVMAVLSATIMGLFVIIGLNMSIQDLPAILNAESNGGSAFTELLSQNVGRVGAAIMHVLLFLAMQCAASANVTSASRLVYSFSREGALPFSTFWSTMHSGLNSPVRAIWLCVGLAAMLGVLGLSANLFELFFAISTVAFYASYAVPVLCRVTVGWDLEYEHGSWRLGAWSRPLCALSGVYCLFMTVVLSLPLSVDSFSYAGPDLAVTFLLSLLSWELGAKKWYQKRRLPKRRLPAMDSVTTMETDFSDESSQQTDDHALEVTAGLGRAYPSSEDLGLSPTIAQPPASLSELLDGGAVISPPSPTRSPTRLMALASPPASLSKKSPPPPASLMELADV